MTIDEVEKLARDASDWRDIDTGEPEWARTERIAFARFILAVLPVVKAAAALVDSDELNSLRRAVNGDIAIAPIHWVFISRLVDAEVERRAKECAVCLASAIEARASKVDGLARVAMEQVAEAVREVGK